MFRSIIASLPRTSVRYASSMVKPAVSFMPFMRFQAPVVPQLTMGLMPKTVPMVEEVVEPLCGETEDNTMYMDSVMRKRRLKMKKHKLRKRRREQRSLKKRLGKI